LIKFVQILFIIHEINLYILIKKLLKLELDFSFILIALTSQLKDYRLCFVINKFTESDFRKTEDLSLTLKNEPEKFFSRYFYTPINSEYELFIIANKGTDGYLIPEAKEADYFLIIKEFIDDEDLDLLISQIKQINDIQAVVDLNPKKLKSKENLLF